MKNKKPIKYNYCHYKSKQNKKVYFGFELNFAVKLNIKYKYHQLKIDNKRFIQLIHKPEISIRLDC